MSAALPGVCERFADEWGAIPWLAPIVHVAARPRDAGVRAQRTAALLLDRLPVAVLGDRVSRTVTV